MKKILTLVFLISQALILRAQITLEHTHNIGAQFSDYPGYWKLSLQRFTSLESKYVLLNPILQEVRIYNLDHSVYKIIPIPNSAFGVSSAFLTIENITDNLFNSDNQIEIAYSYYNAGMGVPSSECRVINENGVNVFQKDSAVFKGFFQTPNGMKMALQNQKEYERNIEIYSLPGSLVASNISLQKNESGNLSNPYPNPSSQIARVEYELPQGESMGELVVYNMDGHLMRKYLVDNTFSDLVLNNSDLPTGTYVYQLSAGNKVSRRKKMIVIK